MAFGKGQFSLIGRGYERGERLCIVRKKGATLSPGSATTKD